MQLPQFQQQHQDLALVTLKLIVLHQVQFIPHQYSLNGAKLRIWYSVFSTWSDWSSCSVTCGSGDQTRSRTCDQNCASVSSGDLRELQSCNEADCPSGKSKINTYWLRLSLALVMMDTLIMVIIYAQKFLKEEEFLKMRLLWLESLCTPIGKSVSIFLWM